jgi:nucleotide-binding universal stress UspA family protein
MTEPPSPATSDPATSDEAPAGQELPERIFLVVVDDTEEMKNALHFACRRALHTGGRVALFDAMEPPEFQHWLGVERVMQEEARQQAEQTLQALAAEVQTRTGKMPVLYLREGRRRDQLMAVIEEEPGISLLVLGMASGREGPGPLVTYLITQMGGQIRLPVTLVPGDLSETEIDAVS